MRRSRTVCPPSLTVTITMTDTVGVANVRARVCDRHVILDMVTKSKSADPPGNDIVVQQGRLSSS